MEKAISDISGALFFVGLFLALLWWQARKIVREFHAMNQYARVLCVKAGCDVHDIKKPKLGWRKV
jgi:hypothetical protein